MRVCVGAGAEDAAFLPEGLQLDHHGADQDPPGTRIQSERPRGGGDRAELFTEPNLKSAEEDFLPL